MEGSHAGDKGEPRGRSWEWSRRDIHRGVMERCHRGSHGETPTGRDPRGESRCVTHWETHRESHRSRRPRGESRDDSERDERVTWWGEPRGDVMRESRGVSQRDIHGMSQGVSWWETHVGSHRGSHGERSTERHSRRFMGRDSEAETPLEETHGGISLGRSTRRLQKPLSHPTVPSFPLHGHKRMGDR